MEEVKKVKISIPSWAAVLYIVISLFMIPWTVFLGMHLPSQHITKNWDITWVGLDTVLIVSLLVTGILAKMDSIYMVVSAVITGTLFMTDAWFDVLGYRLGSIGFSEAMLTAFFGELPMAIMSFSLAVHGLRRLYAKKEDIKPNIAGE